MSQLTQIRRGATDADIKQIAAMISGLRMEGNDLALLCDALNDAMDGSEYQTYGCVDFDDIAGKIYNDCFGANDRVDVPGFGGTYAELDALTVRRVGL